MIMESGMRLNWDKPTVVVMDTSVILHQLAQHSVFELGDTGQASLRERESAQDMLAKWVELQMCWVGSGVWLGGILPQGHKWQMVWAMDAPKKDYWRTEWLRRPEITAALPQRRTRGGKMGGAQPISYKGGRKQASRTFELVRDQVLPMLVGSPYHTFVQPGYEADDIIAALTVVNESHCDNNIIVATVDNDLLGLVRESVGWVCTMGYAPRVRLDMVGVNQWRRKKGLRELDNARELWYEKAYNEGDESDKIPACPTGETLPAIDLLEPPQEHRLWDRAVLVEAMKVALTNFVPSNMDGLEARVKLKELGCEPVIAPLEVPRYLLEL